jgi:hypothetical protein
MLADLLTLGARLCFAPPARRRIGISRRARFCSTNPRCCRRRKYAGAPTRTDQTSTASSFIHRENAAFVHRERDDPQRRWHREARGRAKDFVTSAHLGPHMDVAKAELTMTSQR